MLETVIHCPMCKSSAQHVRFEEVPDFVFHATDEKWLIKACESCASLFLSYRPGMDSIGPYYERYYTHENEAGSKPISGINVQSGFAKKLANSWRNHRYRSNRPSLGSVGVAVAMAVPPLRKWIDSECRHLPDKSSTDRPLRVLDVGFGDGRFLKFVREIGHEAAGLEIDPKAVAQGRDELLDVHQGNIGAAIPNWGENYFDYITMSHVIEHVHQPREVIELAERLLKPDGRLWIECPNPESRGLAVYGNRWRDLDPPRHLCIPSLPALCSVAAEYGLTLDVVHQRPFVPFEVYPFSAVASGHSKASGYFNAVWAELARVFQPRQSEWLTLTFKKEVSGS